MARRRPVAHRSRGRQHLLPPTGLVLLATLLFASWLGVGLRGRDSDRLGLTVPSPTSPIAPSSSDTNISIPSRDIPMPRPGKQPTRESTPADLPSPTLVQTVLIGDFGELPAPNMPQGRPDLAQLRPHYALAFSLDAVPTQALVYRLVPRDWDIRQVELLADALGIEAEATQLGNGFHVADNRHQLYVSGDQIQFQRLETSPPGGTLPGDEQLIARARQWLREHELVGTKLGPGLVISRLEEAGLATVVFQPLEPTPILAAVPRASVVVASNGTIWQASINWPARFEPSIYGLRDPASLWQDVVQGRAYLEIDATMPPQADEPVAVAITLTGVDIVYTDAGRPGDRYLTPLVRFYGEAAIPGIDGTVAARTTVPAVIAQAVPRG